MTRTLHPVVTAAFVLLCAASGVVARSQGAATAQRPDAPGPGARTTATPPESPTTARDHLAKARAVLDSLDPAALTGPAASAFADLRRLFGDMEKSYLESGVTKGASEERPSGSTRFTITKRGTWTSYIGDVDRLTGELLGFPTASGIVLDVDDAVKARLRTFRTHLTDFALAADGTAGAAGAEPAKKP